MDWRRALTIWAILPAAATVYFFIFWWWFDFWRRRRAQTYALMAGTFLALGIAAATLGRWTFAGRLPVPTWTQALGWAVIAAATAFGSVADRQLGLRVRAFAPFFDDHGRIELKTTGAYGVVRHPIYASGSWFQLGAFLVTGYPAVLAAWAVFTLGALWFTRREEERLAMLLDDPRAYERYRERVPALFPWFRRG